MRLFVYGTLLSGQEGHVLLAGCRLLHAARTEPRYRLIDMGAYPALLDEGGCSVTGELYDVPEACLDDLDRFEGTPSLYDRRPVKLEGGGEAQAYFLSESAKPRLDEFLATSERTHAAEIVGGDWKLHRCRAS
jgi:gamma-glutamylcyclotransferase (GGCT)/AIG2-like uncharacterized protein YtfP